MPRFLLALCGLAMLTMAQSKVERLQDVRKIYVAPLRGENESIALLLNAKLVSYLAKQQRIVVVD